MPGILGADSKKRSNEMFSRVLSCITSCLSLSEIAVNFFLQKAICDELGELFQHAGDSVDSNALDVLFRLISIVESQGIKECLLRTIVRSAKRNPQKCKRSVQDNAELPDLSQMSMRVRFKFVKLLYQLVGEDEEFLSAGRGSSAQFQSNSQTKAGSATNPGITSSGGLMNSQTSLLNNNSNGGNVGAALNSIFKSGKSFQSQLISEMVSWLKSEPSIAARILKFLLSVEPRRATIVKLCLLRNIDLNEEAQLFFLEYLCTSFEKNQAAGFEDIMQHVLSYVNNCTRSLSHLVRLKSSKILHHFPYFDDALLMRTIKLEQFQDYRVNKGTPSKSGSTPTKNESERFSMSHGYGAIVHLLEDEYNDVRKSAIEIIRNFGRQSGSFAKECRDILFYMLNDENDSVRIRAIEVIQCVLATESRISARGGESIRLISLKTDEIESLMFNLKEQVVRLRIVIYELLGRVWFADMSQLNLVVDIALANIFTFSDSSYIYSMCRNIGQANAELVKTHICTILQIGDVFHVQEPHWKDKSHVYRMILIANAFASRKEIAEQIDKLLPFYFLKQYDMMQDLMPSYFHDLVVEQREVLPSQSSTNNTSNNANDLLNNSGTGNSNMESNGSSSHSGSNLNLLNLLASNLAEIDFKAEVFHVISENAKVMQQGTSSQDASLSFTSALAKVAWHMHRLIRAAKSKRGGGSSSSSTTATTTTTTTATTTATTTTTPSTTSSSTNTNNNQTTLPTSVSTFSEHSMTFEYFSKIIGKLHKISCKYLLSEVNERLVQRVLFVALIHVPILLTSGVAESDFESVKYLKAMAFVIECIKQFQADNNNYNNIMNSTAAAAQSAGTSNSSVMNAINNSINLVLQSQQSSSSATAGSSFLKPAGNPYFLLHSHLDEGSRIASEVLANPQGLQDPVQRAAYQMRYKRFLASLPYKLIFSKKFYQVNGSSNPSSGSGIGNNNNNSNSNNNNSNNVSTGSSANSASNNLNQSQQHSIQLRSARIIVPKLTDIIEIQSKYMARTSFVAEITHFDTAEQRKHLQLVVEYSNGSKEAMQLLEDDFVMIGDSTHVINTNLFFQRIDWTTTSQAMVTLSYYKPLSFLSMHNLHRELPVFAPSEHAAASLSAAVTLAKADQLSLVVKSRIG